MCHQSIGLIARTLEDAGITTVSLTSAWSITAAVRPPRAAFVDYPLGHTSGRAFDRPGQRAIVKAALDLASTVRTPGTIVDLELDWGDNAWRADPLRTDTGDTSGGSPSGGNSGGDSRTERHDTPRYQHPDDLAAAEARVGREAACRACVGFD